MKLKATITALLLVGVGLGYAGVAGAQSCAGTQSTLSSTTTSFAGNNCGNNSNFTRICSNGDTLGGGGMDVISFPIGASATAITFSLQSAAFVPELAVLGSPCSSSTACIVDTTIAATGTASGTVPAGQAAGTYFVFVADTNDANCGAYNLSFTGTLPVKLQDFSVQ
jgi:hypothetical protein